MPYARPYRTKGADRVVRYRRTNADARLAAVTKRRQANKPVKRIQRAAYVPQRVKNTESIGVLARQVRKLQLSQLGLMQKYMESVVIAPGSPVSVFTNQRPVCFMVNDFTEHARVYGLDANRQSVYTMWTKYTFPYSVDGEMNYWRDAMNDTVSNTVYQPVRSILEFEITCKDMDQFDDNRYFKIHILKPKKVLPASNMHNLTLPMSLYGLGELAASNMLAKNMINKTYFDVLAERSMTFRNPNPGMYSPKKLARINIPFPAKYIAAELAGSSVPTNQELWMNIPVKDQIWCVLSNSEGVVDKFEVTIRRKNFWRDPSGVAS